MTTDELHAVRRFAGLEGGDLAWLTAAGPELRLSPGDLLCQEGDTDVAFFVLLAGKLDVIKRLGAEETVLANHRAGSFTGEVPLLTGAPSHATVRALAPSCGIRLESEQVQRMLTTWGAVVTTVLRAVARRIRFVGSTLLQQPKLAGTGEA